MAPPPNEPANCVLGLLAHTVWFGPAFTCAAGLIVITMDELEVPGTLVNVSVAEPAAISAGLGV